MAEQRNQTKYQVNLSEPLRCLDPQLLTRIDQALCRVGQFGEVRLIVAKGQVRFIQVTQSESVSEIHTENSDS